MSVGLGGWVFHQPWLYLAMLSVAIDERSHDSSIQETPLDCSLLVGESDLHCDLNYQSKGQLWHSYEEGQEGVLTHFWLVHVYCC